MLRRLTLIVVAAGALYGGYWFIGKGAVTRGIASVTEELRGEGWEIAYDDLRVAGFPNRFDTTVTAPRIGTPDGGATWWAETLTVYALSYRPNEVIALFPAAQDIALADQSISLSTDGMRASARVQAALALPLDDLTIESGPFSAASTAGWEVIFDRSVVAFRAGGPAANAYDFYVRFDAPSLDGVGVPGLTLDVVSIDAQALFDAPLDRHAASPALLEVTLRDARMVQGTASLSAAGLVVFGPDGLGDGEITVTAIEGEALIDTFEVAGALLPERADGLRGALGAMTTGASDVTAPVTIPITITGGVARIGFLPLGQVRIAPRG